MPAEAPRGRVVVLSPHPDDAVWSLGSGLAPWAGGRQIVLLSLFAGDAGPAIARAHASEQRWRCFASPGQRRQEDQRAAALLGCACSSLGAQDAALRLDGHGEFLHASPQSLFLTPDPDAWPEPDPGLLQRLRGCLRPQDVLCAPLAIGAHVDHCLTHRLARALDHRLFFYSDFPYVEQCSPQHELEHMQALGLRLRPRDIACSWSRWREAALCYRSQVLMLFGSQGRFLDALKRHSRAQGERAFCRIWSTRAM